MAIVVGIVVVAGGAAGAFVLFGGSDDSSGDDSTDRSSEPVGPTETALGDDVAAEPSGTGVDTTTDASEPPTTDAAAPTTVSGRPVDVDEAWLLDRGDGEFDWGLTVRVPDGADTRGDVAVRVRLVGADDDVLDEIQYTLDGVSDRGATAVAGRLSEREGVPTRLDFDVAVGEVVDELGLPDVLETRAIERIDDELRGRIRSTSTDELTDIAMVLVWREVTEGTGSTVSSGRQPDPRPIVDVVVYEIDRIRPGIDAVFAIDLADLRTPDGLPDDVFWAPTG